MTFSILLKSRIGDKDYGTGKIVRMSNQQQTMSDPMKKKEAVKEEMSKAMLREKLKTIGSKEQLDEEIECLWEYVKPVMEDLIALEIEATRKKDDINSLFREAESNQKYVDGLLDKVISIEAETTTLYAVLLEKAAQKEKENSSIFKLVNKFESKKHETNAAMFAANKMRDELSALRIKTSTMKDRIIAMISKLRREIRDRDKLSVQIRCKRDMLNALLTMMEGKLVEVGAFHQEPSDDDSARLPSGNLTAGSDCVSDEDSARLPSGNLTAELHFVLHETSRLFGSGKTEQLLYTIRMNIQ